MVIQNGYLTKWTKEVRFLEMQVMTIRLQPMMQISTWTVDNHVKKLLSENHVSEHIYIVIQK